ncbi:hypothetical protein TNCV_1548281 [Trichonephila clavipes]|nr:hypothetical protein TNCV_1548281 [Trichonephila clavipes]
MIGIVTNFLLLSHRQVIRKTPEIEPQTEPNMTAFSRGSFNINQNLYSVGYQELLPDYSRISELILGTPTTAGGEKKATHQMT